MAIDRGEFLEALRESYEPYYDIHPNDSVTPLPLVFRADFHSHGESYFLIKSAKIWSDDTHEYTFLFSADRFTPEIVDACVDYALDTALPMVEPRKDHHYSNVHAIFVADQFDDAVRSAITKRRFSKSYKMGIYGFTLLKTAFIDLSSMDYGTNKEGHDLGDFIKKLFPKKYSKKKFLKSKE